MGTGAGRQIRAGRRLAATLLATTLLGGPGARAQPAMPASEPVTLAIPAQPLAAAIDAFIRQTGWQISYPSALARGKTATAVSGSLPPAEALQRLVAGTGLQVRIGAPGSAAVVAPSVDVVGSIEEPSVLLDTLSVEGQGNTGFGPVNRFVAADSSVASKSSAPIIETPYSVSVVTREQIEVRDPKTIEQTLRYAPGVQTSPVSSDLRWPLGGFNIRGFPAVVLLDGTTLNVTTDNFSASVNSDPYLLERIEVLGGPPSVLYGQSAPGGAIVLQSKRPVDAPIHEIITGTGSYGRIQGAFDLGGRVDPDGQFLYRVTGEGFRAGTQIDHVENERIAIAPAFTWNIADDTKLTILLNYQNEPKLAGFTTFPWVGSYVPGPLGRIPRHFFWGEPTYNAFRRTQYMGGYQFEHRFSDALLLRQNLKYIDIEGHYRDVLWGLGLADDGRTLQRAFMADDDRFWSLNVDTQAEAKFSVLGTDQTVLAGVDHYRLSNINQLSYYRRNAPSIDIFAPQYGNYTPPDLHKDPFTSSLRQTGIYAQDLIKFGGWRLLGGIRKDWAENWSSPSTDARQNSEAVTGRLGLAYVFESGLTPYANFATSFQPQGGTTAPERGRTLFKPTTGTQYEVGLKYQPAGLQSFAELSAFDITQQNVLTADPIYRTYSVQAGEIRSRGTTASVTLSLADNLNLLATYTYLDLKTTKSSQADLWLPVGKVPWYAPEHVASLWADYAFGPGDLIPGLRIGGGLRWRGSALISGAGPYRLPDLALVDATLRYDFGVTNPALNGVDASLNVSNLFDTVFLGGCNLMGRNCQWGDGRLITAQVRYRW